MTTADNVRAWWDAVLAAHYKTRDYVSLGIWAQDNVPGLLAEVEQLERERGVEETNAQRWMTEAEDWKVRAEAAEQRVRKLEQALREIEASETEWRLGVDANCEILRSIARRALTRDADEGTV